MTQRRTGLALLALALAFVLVSGIHPKERLTWFMEVAPILIGAPILVASYSRFPLSLLAAVLLTIHAGILALGGHYTYAEVPLGFWVRDALGLARNHYDRLGHLAQGFIPAILVREVLRRVLKLPSGGWVFFLTSSVCLAVSACYELIEWWAALLLGQGADAFLGTQGDVWDTQWDMFLALCGAFYAQVLLTRLHERQLATVPYVK
jgi:putative membrane protein